MAAVERWDGDQVEDEEDEIEEDDVVEEQRYWEEWWEALRGNSENMVGEGHGGDDSCRSASDGVLEDDEKDQRNSRRQQVADGAGKRDEDVVAHVVLEIARGDRGGFGPAKEHAAVDQSDDRKDDGAEGVEVFEGIEGDAAEHASCGVAEAVGSPGVGALVNAEGENEDHYLEDDEEDFLVHISFKSTGVGAKEP